MARYNAFETSQEAWHYTNMSRSVAETMLTRRRAKGTFLVRDSERVQGASVLSVFQDDLVHHYRLTIREDNSVVVDGVDAVYPSLRAMIHALQTENILASPPIIPLELNNTGIYEETPSHASTTDDDDDDDDEDGDDDESTGDCRLISALKSSLDLNHATSRSDPSAMGQLQQYIQGTACQDSNAIKSMGSIPGFNEMLHAAAKPLLTELRRFTTRMEATRNLFQLASEERGFPGAEPFQLHELDESKADEDPLLYLIHNLQMARDISQDASTQVLPCYPGHVHTSRAHATSFLRHSTCRHSEKEALIYEEGRARDDNVYSYNVRKVEKVMGKAEELTVDVNQGVVLTRHSAGSQDNKTYRHDEVVQLIKSRSNKQRLAILFQGKRRKDYIFEDLQHREDFCQKVRMLKMRHGGHQLEDSRHSKLSIWIGTFNMGDVAAPNDLSSWFACQGQGRALPSNSEHDILAIGCQEAGMAEKDWLALVRQHIGAGYQQLAFAKLLQIRLVVFVRDQHMNKVSHLQQSVVATGLANKLGNKGGVGIAFFVNQTSFCFINSHLAAGSEKLLKRNTNALDIFSKLQLGQKHLSGFDILNQFHHVFFFGDLNYRINLPVNMVIDDAKRQQYTRLCQYDQLLMQRGSQKMFFGFEEGPIEFPPSYRYKRGTRDVYEYEKQKASGIKINVPSYTDRIMWRSFPNLYIKQTSYGATTDIMTSDHSPVFATFDIQVTDQHASTLGSGENRCTVFFHSAVAKLKTAANVKFVLQFYANFIDGKQQTVRNSDYDYEPKNPIWAGTDFPRIVPAVADRAYLEHEHLLIAVKSEDGDESYGEGSLSLMNMFSSSAQPCPFKVDLSHHGEFTGTLAGHMCVDGARGKSTMGQTDLVAAGDEDLDALDATLDGSRRTRRAPLRHNATFTEGMASAHGPPAIPPRARMGLSERRPMGAATLAEKERAKRPASMMVPATRAGPSDLNKQYDDLEFFSDLAEEDLQDIGVSAPDIQIIMTAIAKRNASAATP
ncbi:uncharacterized protein MONBRDRAFT_27082 [Monosiga brevicollis MX1]|uniref:phosphatidylinositol-3,4,5-trisphosphate 5-phosphatase n=1 Tax=Monosiga brevicollis TaxID=81824 RepID=A9V491_MONBE|nr:uncharacterized protein MONBRDRAFT_27082 [Monosiga brevicollis MX1]EDQ87577.1 predicted protein [Monosiga brevicollis MX1]|eukprot:XP_001747497.1 hypothetical protein [Monosiga brevicollis MX1]